MFKEYIFNRLKEETTWFGFLAVVGSFGLGLTDAQHDAIVLFGMAMCASPNIDRTKLRRTKSQQM
jgi:hypothetical protein